MRSRAVLLALALLLLASAVAWFVWLGVRGATPEEAPRWAPGTTPAASPLLRGRPARESSTRREPSSAVAPVAASAAPTMDVDQGVPQPRIRGVVRVRLLLGEAEEALEVHGYTPVGVELETSTSSEMRFRVLDETPAFVNLWVGSEAALDGVAVEFHDPLPELITVRVPRMDDPRLSSLVVRLLDEPTGEPLTTAQFDPGPARAVSPADADETLVFDPQWTIGLDGLGLYWPRPPIAPFGADREGRLAFGPERLTALGGGPGRALPWRAILYGISAPGHERVPGPSRGLDRPTGAQLDELRDHGELVFRLPLLPEEGNEIALHLTEPDGRPLGGAVVRPLGPTIIPEEAVAPPWLRADDRGWVRWSSALPVFGMRIYDREGRFRSTVLLEAAHCRPADRRSLAVAAVTRVTLALGTLTEANPLGVALLSLRAPVVVLDDLSNPAHPRHFTGDRGPQAPALLFEAQASVVSADVSRAHPQLETWLPAGTLTASFHTTDGMTLDRSYQEEVRLDPGQTRLTLDWSNFQASAR